MRFARCLGVVVARASPVLCIPVIVVAMTGCSADVVVGVRAARDGSGLIEVAATLDTSAATAIGDPSKVIRGDDLRAAGWAIEAPRTGTDGSVRIVARRAFAGPEQAIATLRSLTGPAGPFANLRVTRRRSLSSIETGFVGVVDLREGLAVFGDDLVAAKLGAPLGIDDAELRRQFGSASPDSVVRLRLRAVLPGSPARSWLLPMGRKTAISMRGRVWRTKVIAPIALALLALTIVLLSGVLRTRRIRADARSRPSIGVVR